MLDHKTDWVGKQLGDYRLLRLLIRHSIADVYLGEHITRHNRAVLRLFHIALRGEDHQDFLNEVQALARLDHPHILRVLDVAVEDDVPFVVLDATSLETLRQRHPHGTRLTPDIFSDYLKHMASALRYIHEQEIIHRNVRPESIVFDAEDKIALSDFSFAFPAHHSILVNTQELTEAVTEAVSYMAPEQIQGNPGPASDQYALAIVVYEWLCGRRPFYGSPTEIIEQQLSASPPPLREFVPELAPALEAVVLRAMAKKPEQRFASVEEFVQALGRAADNNEA